MKFNELTSPPAAPGMARVWAPSLSTSNPPDWDVVIDWNGDFQNNTTPNLNVNFDGVFGGTQTLGAPDPGQRLGQGSAYRQSALLATPSSAGWKAARGPEWCSDVGFRRLLGGDSLGGDSLGGDSLGGDSLGGDSLGGDSLGGDSLGGDSLGGDSLGGDSLGGDSLGGDSLGGDSLGGDSLGGGELDSPTVRGMGRGDPRAFDACILGGTTAQDGCSGAWFDQTGTKHNAQPQAGDAFYHKILLTWFEPTSEPIDFYALTRIGGGVTTEFTLKAEDLTPVGGRVSWVVTDPPPDQLPDHVNFTFTLVPTLDDGEEGTTY